jgi:hypothetical protein
MSVKVSHEWVIPDVSTKEVPIYEPEIPTPSSFLVKMARLKMAEYLKLTLYSPF